jgi:TMEM175 potassium channel family protein
VAHNRVFRCVARYNSTVVWVNMAILLQIAVMPFVMNLYSHYSDTQTAVDLFAAIQVGLGISTAGLWVYLVRAGLAKPDVTRRLASYASTRILFTSAIFALSIALSFWSVSAAQDSWILVIVVQRFVGRWGV